MYIRKFKHEKVKPDGTFEGERGAVHVDGRILMSSPEGGCDLPNCHCSEGHWISFAAPRTSNGVRECSEKLG